MATVWCAAIECEYNEENQCTLPEINLAHGHVHAVYEGFIPRWQCRNYSESAQVAELRRIIELELTRGRKNQEAGR